MALLEAKRNDARTANSDFSSLFKLAEKRYPYDPYAQLNFFRKEQCNPRFELLALLKIVQAIIDSNYHGVNMNHQNIDRLFRSMYDLAFHLQEDLPDGVYEYNLKNLQGVTDQILGPSHYLDEENNHPFDPSYLI